MADFDLDVDSPYPKPTREFLQARPEPLKYPQNFPKYRFYGNNIKTKISAVAQGRRLTTFGYKWEYCNECENKYDNEEWKDIPCEIINGIKGYKISNYSRVKNHRGRITEGHNHESGYLWVSISPKQYLLHRLVAKVFIPNPENKTQVNHIDGNKKTHV